jgi:hypothetical protein
MADRFLRTFLAATVIGAAMGSTSAAVPPRPPTVSVDAARTAVAGIRKLESKRLLLYTDLPSSDAVDQLPAIFDQAFPQWCARFAINPAEHADWRMTGFLIKDKARFEQAGLLPANLPPFRHGYTRYDTLWLYEQPSDYYRRHLLLHEGTHGFMFTLLGRCGPPWYMEGVAELLGTHLLDSGRLTLGYMPKDRAEVPEWGRIRIIKDALAEHRAMRLPDVLDYPPTAHLQTEPYAWCWAAAILLDRDPRYQERFRQLYKNVLAADFNARFRQTFADDWPGLLEQWQVMVCGLEYGYDFARTAIDFTPGRPLPAAGATVRVAADRGWQNSGLRLEEGQSYRLRAFGRYQVGAKPQVWWCEPGGVSLRYYQGRPLGVLLAAIRPEPTGTKTPCAFLHPVVVGLAATLPVTHSGTLFLKINHSAAELADNTGELNVEIRP